MNFEEIESKWHALSQNQLLTYRNTLAEEEKNHLFQQIKELDLNLLKQQKDLLQSKKELSQVSIQPLQNFAVVGNTEHKKNGLKLLEEGKCGCILVAGGQGTRLNQGLSKGMVPVSPVKHKSLFQLFAEKTKAAGIQAGALLPLAIMTSPLNHHSIISYFQSNNYFGLDPAQLFFYSQGTLPFLDRKGDLFLEEKHSIAHGPDGNGSALRKFVDSGIGAQWHNQGIEHVHFVLVDNPLADPFDAELLGFHASQKNDVTIKSTYRLNEAEKVGVLAEKASQVAVVEYSELDDSEKKARTSNGELKYPLANLSQFCFSMSFIRDQAYKNYPLLPLHKAFKAANYLDANGQKVNSIEPYAWKFERYIFDLLHFASRIQVLVYPRDVCFAALKNAQGADSLETVQAALQNLDKKILKNITSQEPPQGPLELSIDFHYPTPELLSKWRGHSIPSKSYLDAYSD